MQTATGTWHSAFSSSGWDEWIWIRRSLKYISHFHKLSNVSPFATKLNIWFLSNSRLE
jgi:hypothetical protein